MRARMTQIQENTQKAGLFGLAKSNKAGWDLTITRSRMYCLVKWTNRTTRVLY